MNFINFYGHKNTKEDFLDNITKFSGNMESLKSHLEQLEIFTSIIPTKNKVLLKEQSKSFKIYSNKNKRQIGIKIPNIFGRGEIFSMDLNFNNKVDSDVSKSALLNLSKDETKYKARDDTNLPKDNTNLTKDNTNLSDDTNSKKVRTNFLIEKAQKMLLSAKNSLGSANIEFSKPGFFFGNLITNKVLINQSNKIVNEKEITVQKIQFLTGTFQKRMQFCIEKANNMFVCSKSFIGSVFGVDMIVKGGISIPKKIFADNLSIPKSFFKKISEDKNAIHESCGNILKYSFLKLIFSKNASMNYKSAFFDGSLKIGKIFGKTILADKYFLGSEVRGYKEGSIAPTIQNKKTGGNSFIQINSRFGYKFGEVEAYAFGDACANSMHGIQECIEILQMSDSSCLGKSVGVGIKMKDGVSITYAIPLTGNLEVENFSIGIDI